MISNRTLDAILKVIESEDNTEIITKYEGFRYFLMHGQYNTEECDFETIHIGRHRYSAKTNLYPNRISINYQNAHNTKIKVVDVGGTEHHGGEVFTYQPNAEDPNFLQYDDMTPTEMTDFLAKECGLIIEED